MWKERIEGFSASIPNSYVVFTVGANQAELEKLERQLQVELPSSLEEVLRESNGVVFGIHIRDHDDAETPLVLSAAGIIEQNLWFREVVEAASDLERDMFENQDFDGFLIFGCQGNGDRFGFGTKVKRVVSDEVFMWSHEGDGFEKMADSLWEFLGPREK